MAGGHAFGDVGNYLRNASDHVGSEYLVGMKYVQKTGPPLLKRAAS
jgi:hypothetical protein